MINLPNYRYLFVFIVSQIAWTGTVIVENNSDYPVLCIYGDSHKLPINTVSHAIKQVILPGDSLGIELSDEKESTIYTYRMLPARLSQLLSEAADTIMVEGKPDFSKMNVSFKELFTKDFSEVALKKLVKFLVANQSPIRYLKLSPEDLNDGKIVSIRNQENSDTIAPLNLGTRTEIESGAGQHNDKATYKLTITNASKFPVLIAYGKQTWGAGISGKGRLDLKLTWWKESAKGVIDAGKDAEIYLDDTVNTKLLIYRISAEEALKNAQYMAEKIASSVAKKTAMNTVLPGSILVNDLSKLFAFYSAYQKAKEKMPFITTSLTPEQLANCANIKITTSENQTTIVCDLN